jgi:hypothetical protein
MTNFIKRMMAVFGLGVVLVTPALGWETRAMNKQIDETNVLVNEGCSGTIIKNDLVLTAAHCILDQYKTVEKEVINEDGVVKKEKFRVAVPGTVSQNMYSGPSIIQTNKYVYKIVKADRSLDLALLKMAPVSQKPAQLSCTDVERGESVYAVGNSFGVLYSSVTKGIVSSLNRSYRDLGLIGELGDLTDDGEHGLVQHSAPIAGGNSGGALYNESGKLVGVNVRGARTGGFSFSVPLEDVKKFIGDEIKEDC